MAGAGVRRREAEAARGRALVGLGLESLTEWGGERGGRVGILVFIVGTRRVNMP